MISISGYHMREAGATVVQELAFTFADAIEYIEGALQRGLDIDVFAPGLSFFFSSGSDIIEEVAKFRAARKIYAKLMKDRFHANNPKSMALKFHAQTAGSSLTSKEPLNNVVRVAYQALAAVMGGAQSLHTNSYDEALALPTTESVRIALRTQQILAYETNLAHTIDPLAGSYYLERLTKDIEEEVWAELETIRQLGGMRQAVEDGYPQRCIMEEAYRHYLKIKRGEQAVVGVNKFLTKEDRNKDIELHFHSPELEDYQIRQLERLKRQRTTKEVLVALRKLKDRARRGGNLFSYVYDCVKSSCTIGEVCGTLREEFGEFHQCLVV
jgi:methylmalonyl-CoA mutase N-terminal domain/subunit